MRTGGRPDDGARRTPTDRRGARIGHVHLKVADLERAIAFYHGVLGFQITQRYPNAAFLAAGGYHHHIGLNTWESGRVAAASGLDRALPHGDRLPVAHGAGGCIAQADRCGHPVGRRGGSRRERGVYLRDPDQNGVELYRDRPAEEWPRTPDGGLAMYNRPLDLEALLREAPIGA